ncbi:radical SAM protein [Clostridium sp. DJ247]|uniref:SPL family radical SAM protein n=1 Tax=Clostridium sp. DJ247 TaxID=2726188 RepID=UPI00162AA1B1|nr:radical SAM protein [Clostridium sp. DJ247]MBC2580041.1 radical SAM protein [Clostridium sp. DJ247]
MVREVNAKTILITSKNPTAWFGVKYVMNIYRGCQHGCIYCDSRSECYRIDDFEDIIIKINAVELLKKELSRKRVKGTIGTGAMSDPYMPIENKYKLTQKALKVIADNKYPVHIITKSNLVLRDVDILQEINNIYASVAITITTADDLLARKVEPWVCASSDRFKAIGILSTLGICVGITMMPILPFIQDNEKNIIEIIKMAKEYGAKFICPSFGMTLRDRQREYYYSRLDELFPGIRNKYEKKFGNNYGCNANNVVKLKNTFYESCEKYGISTKMPSYEKKLSEVQLSFLK